MVRYVSLECNLKCPGAQGPDLQYSINRRHFANSFIPVVSQGIFSASLEHIVKSQAFLKICLTLAGGNFATLRFRTTFIL